MAVIATAVSIFAAVVGWLVDPTSVPALLVVPVAVVVIVIVVLGRRGYGR